MENKIEYETPKVNVISLEGVDVVTASGNGDTPNTPLEW